jgi:hypothetical protein
MDLLRCGDKQGMIEELFDGLMWKNIHSNPTNHEEDK